MKTKRRYERRSAATKTKGKLCNKSAVNFYFKIAFGVKKYLVNLIRACPSARFFRRHKMR